MKKLIFVGMIATALSIFAATRPAHARSAMPPNSRSEAILNVESASGVYEDVREVTLKKAVYLESVGPLTPAFREKIVLEVALNNEDILFANTRVEIDACGSKLVTGIEVGGERLRNPRRITLVDHTTRRCKDIQPYLYDATFSIDGPVTHHEPISRLHAVGNPAR